MKAAKDKSLLKGSAQPKKEGALADASIKNTLMVGLIALVSALGVAGIANFDKLRNTTDKNAEEIGYYVGRKSVVESALRNKEEKVQSLMTSANSAPNGAMATDLSGLLADLRSGRAALQERHARHLELIKRGERLEASKVKTELNEMLVKLGHRLILVELQTTRGKLSKELDGSGVIFAHEIVHSDNFLPTPLYGRRLATHELTAKLQETNKTIFDHAPEHPALP